MAAARSSYLWLPMPSPSAQPRSESRGALFLTLLLLTGCIHHKPAGERLYISDERGDQVVVIDPAAGVVVAHIAAGRRPRGLALAPDGRTLYVAVSGAPIGRPGADEDDTPPADPKADGIAVVDVAKGTVERVLHVGRDPETFVLSRDGGLLYVSNENDGEISRISVDGRENRLSTKVGDQPEGVGISADGKSLFVACEGSDRIAMLEARTLRAIHMIRMKGRPRGILASRDGTHIYATVEDAGKLAIIAASTGRLEKTLDLAQGNMEIRPMGMTETSDGHLFVTTGRYGAVLEIDPNQGKILQTIGNVGDRPWGIGTTADGATLVTANGPSGDVSLINRVSGKVVRRLNIGQSPWGVAGGTINRLR